MNNRLGLLIINKLYVGGRHDMPLRRPATETPSGSLEPGQPSRARSANTCHPASRLATHAACQPDVSNRRQMSDRWNCEIVVIPMNSRSIVLTSIKVFYYSITVFVHLIFFYICELYFSRDFAHCWRAFDMSNKYYLLTYLLCAPSSVISRPTCFSSSLRCCWQVGSAPFVRRRRDCLASPAPFTNIQTYLLRTENTDVSLGWRL